MWTQHHNFPLKEGERPVLVVVQEKGKPIEWTWIGLQENDTGGVGRDVLEKKHFPGTVITGKNRDGYSDDG